MKIQVVLMDVDGTMTGYRTSDGRHSTPMRLLENLVMDGAGVSREEANRRILSCGDINIYCLSEFLDRLNVRRDVYFQALRDDLKGILYVTEDTKRFFRFLKGKGIPLYSATTNSEFMTRAKLAAGGVEADVEHCDWFAGYYSGCFFRDPQGKYSPEFYPLILTHGHFDPAQTMMIGDEPERDMLPALRAGIRYGVNVDRRQKEPYFQKDGGHYVNSLDVLQKLF